jgi:hypothetical protein
VSNRAALPRQQNKNLLHSLSVSAHRLELDGFLVLDMASRPDQVSTPSRFNIYHLINYNGPYRGVSHLKHHQSQRVEYGTLTGCGLVLSLHVGLPEVESFLLC